MKKHLLALIVGATAFSVFGCSGGKETTTESVKPATTSDKKPADSSTKPTDVKPSDTKVVDKDPAATPTEPVKEEPKPVASTKKIPADIRNDAYEYYGLSNGKDVNVELSDGSSAPRKGVRSITLTDVKDGRAIYVISYSGALANQGKTTVALGPKGISVLESTMGKMKTEGLELPAKLSVGTTWKDSTNLEGPAGKIQIDNQSKVIGREKVTTALGTYDALVVESKGVGTIQGKTAKIEGKIWMAKGVGQVKQVISIEVQGMPKQTTTVVEAK